MRNANGGYGVRTENSMGSKSRVSDITFASTGEMFSGAHNNKDAEMPSRRKHVSLTF
jgi:hypothetical protein